MSYVPFLYLIPAVVILLLLLASHGEELPKNGGEETKGIRGWFNRIGLLLYRTLPAYRKKGGEVTTSLGVLEPRLKADDAARMYHADKIWTVLMLIFGGSILACLVSFSAHQERVVDENGRIERRDYGTGAGEETLVFSAVEDETIAREIDVSVTDRQYTREQADALYEEASEKLPAEILNGNASLDEVRDDLALVKELEGYPFAIAWKIGNYSLIHSDGKIQKENVPKEGEVVLLTAQYSYLDYAWEQEVPIRILPVKYTGEELWEQSVEALVREADEATVNDPTMTLPTRIGESDYTWQSKVRDDAPILFLLILLSALAVFFLKDKDLEKRVREREEEMIGDYPQFVSKLTLYLGAGMTVRNVFLKLAGDYIRKRKQGEPMRFLYEEIYRVANELESGVSEGTAYEHFSLRCRSQQYTRLVTLLSQNLRKGNSGLLPLLHEESKKALAERMDHARKRGEEAGTKLLLPMMLMLVIVMVIIMIPAYLSF